jgi:hypothetical protein
MSTSEQLPDLQHSWLALSYAWFRRKIFNILLLSIALILVVIVLPPSRDASNGIATVYLWSSSEGALSSIEFKAVINAQTVIGLSSTDRTIGFERCSVFNRKNWRCTLNEQSYGMSDGHLSVLEASGGGVLNGAEQISRLRWWIRRLVN